MQLWLYTKDSHVMNFMKGAQQCLQEEVAKSKCEQKQARVVREQVRAVYTNKLVKLRQQVYIAIGTESLTDINNY